jgi:hypothetical protein
MNEMNIEVLISVWREWLTDVAAQASVYVIAAGEAARAALDPYLAQMLAVTSELPNLPVICSLMLAFAVLLLCGRVRRTRAAMRGMTNELERYRQQFSAADQRQQHLEARIAHLTSEFSEQRARLRSIEGRVGKPDTLRANAMARAGTRKRDMVECGLSHSEVHLLHALNSARSAQQPAEAAVA